MILSKEQLCIIQTLIGVVPREVWFHCKGESKDPFSGYSEEDQKIAKRKFRKLKRKAGVTKYDSISQVWAKIEYYIQGKGFPE